MVIKERIQYDRYLGLLYDAIQGNLADRNIIMTTRDELLSYCRVTITRIRKNRKFVTYYINYNKMGQVTEKVCEAREEVDPIYEPDLIERFKQ